MRGIHGVHNARSLLRERAARSALVAASVLAAASLAPRSAFAQESPAPVAEHGKSPGEPAVGGRGRVVIDLFGGQSGLGGYNTFVAFIGALSLSSSTDEQVEGSGTRSTYKSTSFGLAPSVDVFVTDRLSLGGRVSATWMSSSAKTEPAPGDASSASQEGEGHGYAVGLAPRIGYALPLSETWALWPRISTSMDVARQEFGPGRALSRTFGAEINLGLAL